MKTKDHHILHAIILSVLFFGLLVSSAFTYYSPSAYSQEQGSSFKSDARTLDNTSSRKVKVGDIDVAYKQLGNVSKKSIVLINGLGMTMDKWSPTLLRDLSSTRTVIIFDNRGVGESTAGTKEFSINQFANDTVGLLDALKIQRADILGFSMGSFIAQELALKNPDRINNLILYASICGSNETVLSSPRVTHFFDAITNASSPTREQADRFTSLMFPAEWLRANPNYRDYVPLLAESVPPKLIQRQLKAAVSWVGTGTCDTLSNIVQPTLVIIGTEDEFTPAANSLIIAERIPAAWLVQIRDGGHGLMYQYPDKFNSVISTFLQTASMNK
jgi:pimeloyl-ACP methyl ester carboxylesterase